VTTSEPGEEMTHASPAIIAFVHQREKPRVPFPTAAAVLEVFTDTTARTIVPDLRPGVFYRRYCRAGATGPGLAPIGRAAPARHPARRKAAT
jgi:hypothetical protein